MRNIIDQLLKSLLYIYFFYCFPLCLYANTFQEEVYQVDVIFFMHQENFPEPEILDTLLTPAFKGSTLAQEGDYLGGSLHEKNAYRKPRPFLPASQKQLTQICQTLEKQPEYNVMFYQSWLQPESCSERFQFTQTKQGDLQLDGQIRIRKSRYYSIDSHLAITSTKTGARIMFNKKYNIKPDTLYYLDHPQAGMLIKIRPLPSLKN